MQQTPQNIVTPTTMANMINHKSKGSGSIISNQASLENCDNTQEQN